MQESSFDRVIDRLENVKGKPHDVLASCPVASHGRGRGDRNPSLHVTHTDGKTLLCCTIGCHIQDVLLALGLDYPDLFDEPPTRTLVASYTYQKRDGTPYHVAERWQTPAGKTFVQRMPDAERPGLPSGFQPALYRLPQVLARAKEGGVVYVVEGEKCVHAAEHLGLVATTGPNGAKGWRDYYWQWLAGVAEVVVVTDNDDPGKAYAAAVVANLRGHNIKTRVVGVKPTQDKADLYDHVAQGFGVDDLVPLNLNRLRPDGSAMSDLLCKVFPPVKWAVQDLVSTGLTLLGGAPKIGKSFITLDLALGVACGGRALSGLICNQGSVLYLTLDNDTERRVKDRANYLWAGRPPSGPIPIEVHTEWPTGVAALAACQEWVNETANPLMVVIDTLVRVEPNFEGDGRQNAYAASTEVLSRWARFAIQSDVAVVAVHHDKKGEEEDWLNRFTGSRGITATAQTLLLVEAKRGAQEGMLRVSGRDIESDDRYMRRTQRSWIVDGPSTPNLRVVNGHEDG